MAATRVAIACQGGGTQTAFTAGVLQYILEERRKRQDFEIVALSGTSGGAVCALLAWYELLVDGEAADDGRPASKLADFWRKGYPEGTSAVPYPAAVVEGLSGFWSTGRWLPAWIRLFDRLRVDVALWLVGQAFPGRMFPAYASVGIRPYYFHDLFMLLDVMSPLADLPLAALRQAARMLPPWWRNCVEDGLSVDVFHAGGVLRRELDAQCALRALLERTLTKEDIRALRRRLDASNGSLPELLIGAVDVLRTQPYKPGAGEKLEERTNFKVFRGSRDLDRIVDAALASAAMPTFMRAVETGERFYWDGLFSQNPPIHELPDVHGSGGAPNDRPDLNPEEIWIIWINPRERRYEPQLVEDIEDRRNELAGNISLLQEIRSIRRMNELTVHGRTYRKVGFQHICMQRELAEGFAVPSKIDRRQEFVYLLMDEGRSRARDFLEHWRN